MHRTEELEITERARARPASVQQVDGQRNKSSRQTNQGERIQEMQMRSTGVFRSVRGSP